LQELREEAPADHFTLGWLTRSLDKQSFGLIILILAVIAAAPGISFVAGLLLLIPACEMIAGRPAPVFPSWIAERPLPTKHLGAVVRRAIPMLRGLEKFVYPRGPAPAEAAKRIVGIAVVLLTARLLLTPIPLSNVLPAVLIAFISLAYLEKDGLMLSLGLVAGFIVIAADLVAVWQMVQGAKVMV
jgi:hypothetical protein